MAMTSKDQNLARVRLNQQRCRERKRAHVAELEAQVNALQDQLRDCSPCTSAPSTAIVLEDNLQSSIRENSARRDLLLALNISDDMQRHYIDSAALRDSIRNMLDMNQSFGVNSIDKTALREGRSSDGSAAQSPLATSVTPFVEETKVQQTSHQNHSWSAAMPLFEHDQNSSHWAMPLEARDWLLDIPREDAALNAATIANVNEQHSLPNTRISPSRHTVSHDQIVDVAPSSSLCSGKTSLDRCFYETAINFRPAQNTTACSVAIHMLLQHNRKGLSLAQLHDRMKPGFCAADDGKDHCRMQDSLLLRLLSEVSTF